MVIPLNWYRGEVVFANSVHNLIESPTNFVAYDDIWLK